MPALRTGESGGETRLPERVTATRRIRLTLAYDGTPFHGWQVQPGLPTIQGTLEEIFGAMEKKPVHVAGSGRTWPYCPM